MNEKGRSWLLSQLVKARESNLVLTLLSDTSDKEIQERQYKGPDSQSGVREVKKEGKIVKTFAIKWCVCVSRLP